MSWKRVGSLYAGDWVMWDCTENEDSQVLPLDLEVAIKKLGAEESAHRRASAAWKRWAKTKLWPIIRWEKQQQLEMKENAWMLQEDGGEPFEAERRGAEEALGEYRRRFQRYVHDTNRVPDGIRMFDILEALEAEVQSGQWQPEEAAP